MLQQLMRARDTKIKDFSNTLFPDLVTDYETWKLTLPNVLILDMSLAVAPRIQLSSTVPLAVYAVEGAEYNDVMAAYEAWLLANPTYLPLGNPMVNVAVDVTDTDPWKLTVTYYNRANVPDDVYGYRLAVMYCYNYNYKN